MYIFYGEDLANGETNVAMRVVCEFVQGRPCHNEMSKITKGLTASLSIHKRSIMSLYAAQKPKELNSAEKVGER